MKFLFSLTLLVCASGASAQTVTTNKFAGEYMGVMLSSSTNCTERVLVDLYFYTNRVVEALVWNYDFDRIDVYATGTNTAGGKFTLFFADAGYVMKGTVGSHKASGTVKSILPGQCAYTFSAQRRWKRSYDPNFSE